MSIGLMLGVFVGNFIGWGLLFGKWGQGFCIGVLAAILTGICR